MKTLRRPKSLARCAVIWLWWLVLAAALIAMGAWLLGRIASDRWAASQWLSWAPSPIPIILTAILFGLVWIRLPRQLSATSRRVVIGLAAIGLAASTAWFLTIEHRFHQRDRVDADGVRIVHWTDDHPRADNFERVVETMAGQRGDITILSHAGTIIGDHRIQNWLGGSGGARISGFGIFTTLPIRRMERILREDDIVLAYVQIDATSVVGRVLNIYLLDLPSDPHRSRAEIAERVRTALAEAAGIPPADIVIGDANIPRGSWSLRRMFPTFVHAFEQAGHGYGATYHRAFPLLHIDQFLLSPDWRATDYDIVDPGFGRHQLHAATILPWTASSD